MTGFEEIENLEEDTWLDFFEVEVEEFIKLLYNPFVKSFCERTIISAKNWLLPFLDFSITKEN